MSTEEKAKVMNEDAIKEIEELEESASHSGDDFQYEPVPEGKRQNWYDLVFVWFGAAMVAQLYQAGVTVTIGTGGLPNGLKAILGGALFLALFTALSGYVGYKTHCNAALSSRFAYGSVGVAIPGFHIADIGWYVVNAAMFCSILVTLFPAIDINRTGTRKEDLLLPEDVLNRVWILRKILAPMSPIDSMEFLLDKMRGSKSNKDILDGMSK